jgi:hypothetical protein
MTMKRTPGDEGGGAAPAERAGDARDGARTGPGAEVGPRRRYEAPRLARRRAVSRATLFTGSGPESGGVIG